MDEEKSPILRKKKKVQPASSSPDAECICMDSQSFCCPKHNPDDIEFEKSRGWGGSSSQFPNVLMRNCTSTTHTIIIHTHQSILF